MKTINDTRIVFDANLKLCIRNLREREPILIECLKSYDTTLLQECQEKIRNYFLIHQHEFNVAGKLTNHYQSMPDYYALLCANICDLTMCESWDDVIKQFRHESENYVWDNILTLCNYTEGQVSKECICMCSHNCCPENMGIVNNRYTGLNAFIACDCIEKTGIINSYQFKKKARKNETYAKIILEKQKKREEEKVRINKWETLVTTYLNKKNNYRKCIECGTLSILITEPTWKKKCIHCFHQIGVCLIKPSKKSV